MPDAASAAAGPRPEPFIPQAAPAALEDLRARLRATLAGRARGRLRRLLGPTSATSASRRRTGGRVRLAGAGPALARFPRFRVAVGDLQIQVLLHARAAGLGLVLPLVLCHGRRTAASFWRYWPSVTSDSTPRLFGLTTRLSQNSWRPWRPEQHYPPEHRNTNTGTPQTPEHRNTGTPEHRNTSRPQTPARHRNTGTPEHRNTGTPDTGTPEHRNTGRPPEHRTPEHLEHRNTGNASSEADGNVDVMEAWLAAYGGSLQSRQR